MQPTIVLKPLTVEYCPICTLPFEFCDWTSKPDKCREWKQKNRPQLIKEGSEIPTGTTEPEKVEQVKKPKEKKHYIAYDVKQRMKKKYITTIWGLSGYKIDSKDFSKKCSKKFACSCNVVDDDKIQIQGDISQWIYDYLSAEYKIEEKYILTGEEWKEKEDKLKEKEDKKKKKEEEKKESEVKKEEKKEEEKPQPAKTQQKQAKLSEPLNQPD